MPAKPPAIGTAVTERITALAQQIRTHRKALRVSATAAAEAAGIRSDNVVLWVYIISGLCAAIGGILIAGRMDSVTPRTGAGWIFQVQAAAIIGGVSLAGGRGSMIGALGGVLLWGILKVCGLVGLFGADFTALFGTVVTEALNAVITGSVHDLIRGSLMVSLGLLGLSLLARPFWPDLKLVSFQRAAIWGIAIQAYLLNAPGIYTELETWRVNLSEEVASAVSTGATTHTRAHRAQWHVEVVKHQNALLRAETHLLRKLLQPRADQVHRHVDLDQTQRLPLCRAARDPGLGGLLPAQSGRRRQPLDHFEANVVGCSGVL